MARPLFEQGTKHATGRPPDIPPSMRELNERLKRVEVASAGPIDLGKLPLHALTDGLESNWNPEARTFIARGSIVVENLSQAVRDRLNP